MRHAMPCPRTDTPAMKWGRVLHAAVLDPAVFAAKARMFDGRRAGAAYEEAVTLAGGADWVLKPDEMADVKAIQAAIAEHSVASGLIAGSRHEVSMRWGHGAYKARVDGYHRDGTLYDYKTTSAAMPRQFATQAASLGYHLQLAWYRFGCDMNQMPVSRVCIIAQESSAPYDLAVYEMDMDQITAAGHEANRIVAEYEACVIAGKFPGTCPGSLPLLLPEWGAGLGETELIMEESEVRRG